MRKFLGLILNAILILLLAQPQQVYAASASVSISTSVNSTTVGNTIAVTIGIAADEVIGYGVAIAYDPAMLEYQGGGDGGGSGTITIINEGDGTTTSYSRTLMFKAVGVGTVKLQSSEFAGGIFGYNSGTLAVTWGSATVTVAAPQAPASTEGGGNSGDGTTEALKGSGDNSLKSLEISPGTLSPAFQPGTTAYSVTLPEDTTSIVVSAVPNDAKATVAVSHNNDLEPGENKTYIVVTAENGTQKTYVLNITCGEAKEPDEAEAQTVTVNGAEYAIASAKQLETVEAPEGFIAGETDYKGIKVPVYHSPNRKLQLMYLLDAEGQGKWYIYTEKTENFTLYIEEKNATNRYVILTPGEDVVIPDGYQKSELNLNGTPVTSYVCNGDDSIVLIYAMNLDGEPGFYFYDTVEGTYQRYHESEILEPVAPAADMTEAPAVIPVPEETDNTQVLRVAVYILAGLCIIMLGMLIYIGVRMKQDSDSSLT